MRVCSTCFIEKEETEFYKSKRKDGLEPYCKTCRNSWNKLSYEKNKKEWKERTKKTRLLREYNLSEEDVICLLRYQDDRCLICNEIITLKTAKTKFSAVIDHNHETGKVRGILCHHCNMGLGLFKDNPKILKLASEYLEKE